MSFPKITSCLICEIVRFEVHGKLSLLGFSGVSPDVKLIVPRLGVPVPLAFVIFGEDAFGGSYNLKWTIVDNLGKYVLPPTATHPALPRRERLGLAIQAQAAFPTAGEFRLQLFVEEKLHFEAPFQVTQRRENV